MFEQAIRNIDDALRKEAGCTTELDYLQAVLKSRS
jgi:type I restriction enzyme M protein